MTRLIVRAGAALAGVLIMHAPAVLGARAAEQTTRVAAQAAPLQAVAPSGAPAETPAPMTSDAGDLRHLRLGANATQQPTAGFIGFVCADQPDTRLQGWTDYKTCPADAHGLHPIGFKYDDNQNERALLNSALGGTKVAGHPVVLTLLFSDDGVAQELRIVTDPNVPPYLHKKAFLLTSQVKVQFGSDGWTCEAGQPTSNEQPISDLFLKQHCEKVTPTRHYDMSTRLYRHPGDNLMKDMVNETALTISLRH